MHLVVLFPALQEADVLAVEDAKRFLQGPHQQEPECMATGTETDAMVAANVAAAAAHSSLMRCILLVTQKDNS